MNKCQVHNQLVSWDGETSTAYSPTLLLLLTVTDTLNYFTPTLKESRCGSSQW